VGHVAHGLRELTSADGEAGKTPGAGGRDFLNDYNAHHASIKDSVDKLHKKIDGMKKTDGVHWGHVGDAHHVSESLKNLSSMFKDQ
jgi:hypothetical protein